MSSHAQEPGGNPWCLAAMLAPVCLLALTAVLASQTTAMTTNEDTRSLGSGGKQLAPPTRTHRIAGQASPAREYPGVELLAVPLFAGVARTGSTALGDGVLHVVRVDPKQAKLVAIATSAEGTAGRTAGAWADAMGFVATINAGMFATDHRSHVGFFRTNAGASTLHVNQGSWNEYRTALAFSPRRAGVPAAAVVDLPSGAGAAAARARLLADYDVVVQNLRLIESTADGPRCVWRENGKRWSEAAIAQDDQGRVLFLFTRTPLSMKAWCDRVLATSLHIVRAMHVEGGPEASLSVRSPASSLDLAGSYETGFNENDGNQEQWALPNVIAVGR